MRTMPEATTTPPAEGELVRLMPRSLLPISPVSAGRNLTINVAVYGEDGHGLADLRRLRRRDHAASHGTSRSAARRRDPADGVRDLAGLGGRQPLALHTLYICAAVPADLLRPLADREGCAAVRRVLANQNPGARLN